MAHLGCGARVGGLNFGASTLGQTGGSKCCWQPAGPSCGVLASLHPRRLRAITEGLVKEPLPASLPDTNSGMQEIRINWPKVDCRIGVGGLGDWPFYNGARMDRQDGWLDGDGVEQMYSSSGPEMPAGRSYSGSPLPPPPTVGVVKHPSLPAKVSSLPWFLVDQATKLCCPGHSEGRHPT